MRDTQSSQHDAILGALRTNRAQLLEQLQSDKSLQEAWALREQERTGAAWFCSKAQEDVPWAFAQECFLLLLALARHLSAQMALFEQAPPSLANLRTPEAAPPLPPDVLSVSQQKTLGAALQFAVSLGLCPHLAPGVGLAPGRRSAFGPVLAGLTAGHGVAAPSAPPAERRLLIAARVLLRLSDLPSLATLVFSRHLGDVMAALCQLGHQPQRSEGAKVTQSLRPHALTPTHAWACQTPCQ